MFEKYGNWAISNQAPKYLYMEKAQRLSPLLESTGNSWETVG